MSSVEQVFVGLADGMASVRGHLGDWPGLSVGNVAVSATDLGVADVVVHVEPGEHQQVCSRLIAWHAALIDPVLVVGETGDEWPVVRLHGRLGDGTRATVVGPLELDRVDIAASVLGWLRDQVGGRP